jgi:hypothetical protein
LDTRPLLEQLQAGLGEAGEEGVLAALTFVAARDVRFAEDELSAARRRAMLLLAAGGDPHRALEPESRAVRSLARDLDAPQQRAELAAALERLQAGSAGLEGITAALVRLRDDPDFAWRWLACALLAEEVAGEGAG